MAAEGVLFNIAGGIINTLAPLVAKEIGVLWGVQDELEKLQDTVSTIKDVLLDAEQKQTRNRTISGWLRRLSDLLYQADDLLDDIFTEAQRQELMTRGKKAKKVRIFFSTSNQLVYGRKIGHKIKDIRGRFHAFAADINNFNFLVRPEEATASYRKRVDTHSYLGAEIVIGREDDKKEVIDHLMKSNVEGNVSVISIVGLGGLGKTTLAKLIFNDKDIQKNFEVKIWVCVSDNFEDKDIIKKILESAKGGKPQTDLMETLVRDLRKEIDGKKYLLVLDDVWNENGEEWSKLKNLLMGGGKGSKILVTTRQENIAKIMQSKICHLNGLGEEASWELFKKVAFENGVESESLEEMGKVILKKCRGVPLAIKTMGKLLYSKSSENWQRFIDKELSKITQEATDILPTLKLSYNNLPSPLKHCFAYCSLFPKDYEFKKAKLINLWIAQGYVESKEDQCLEEIGHEYFLNLFSRSFFQEAKMDDFGEIIGCKMHDLMHDLAISVARPLISTFPFENGTNYKKIRHVIVTSKESFDSSILSSLCKARMIRTFMVNEIKGDWEVILKHFKFLRVLCLRKCILKHVPSSIGKLKYLRYLDFSYNSQLKKLPSSITTLVNLRHLNISRCQVRYLPHKMSQLTNLETLNLSGCWSLKELPRDINRLVNLKHLRIQDCYGLRYMPSKLRQLTNLQVLTDFVVNSGSFSRNGSGLVGLNGLNKLSGRLVIRRLSCGKGVLKDYKVANLMGKENLNFLYLKWSSEDVVNDCDDDVSLEGLQPHQNLKHLKILGHWCSKHPSWLSSLTSLVSLSLISCSKWRFLAPLSKLPFLESLTLENMKGMEYISHCGEWSDYSQSLSPATFFPSLKIITLIEFPNLKGWWGDSFAEVESLLLSSVSMIFFPSLTKMELYNCPNLMGLWGDSSVEVKSLLLSFPLLSNLRIKDCPKLTSMPMFPHLESLWLKNGSCKPLQQTKIMNTSAAISSSKLASSSCTTLSKLKQIYFESVTDLEVLLEKGLQTFTSLEILTLRDSDKLKSLSSVIQHLKIVQKLFIWNCPLCEEDDGGMQLHGLENLLSLSFQQLPRLSSLPQGLQRATTLKKLSISYCGSLTTLSPIVQHLTTVEELEISDCPMCVDDENGMQWQGLKSLLSLSFKNLSKLSSFPLGLQHVTTLKKLSISNCESLTTPSRVIKHFTTVEELYISNCPICVDDEMQWQGLKSLLSLSFINFLQLSLPRGLQHITTLKKLFISHWTSLTTIPEEIRLSKSLEELEIYSCPNLASLPIGTCEPWSLQNLTIVGCPILSQKCEREKGEYWPKIAHIPRLCLKPPQESKSGLTRKFRKFRPWRH